MKELKAQIEVLLDNFEPNFKIAKLIKENLKEYYTTLPKTFAQTTGKDFLVKHTKKIDTIIKLVYRIAIREMFGYYFPTKNYIPLTIVALGSYGREQLSPKSDIDIMFIYKNIPAYNILPLIEKMYYLLIDAGLKLGHRVDEIDELEDVANSDTTIKTAILESRFIDGSKPLWFDTENRINRIRHNNQKKFILAKIEERRKNRAKYPLMMESNLKEGVGGFRDANLIYWIGKLLYNAPRIKDLPKEIVDEKDYTEFRVALEFLFKVRSALHLCVKKKTDYLRLDDLPQVASLLGYKSNKAHMTFAKRVNKSLRTIWLYSRIWLDAIASKHVSIYKEYLKPEKNYESAEELLRFLISSANRPYRSHPKLNLQLLHTTQEIDNRVYPSLIIKIFKAKYTSSILTALSEANRLGQYIQPIKKVEALPQFDGYHKFTVDTHLIKCVESLENLENSKLKKIYNDLDEDKKLILKLAIFLHDIGKGREMDHHILGAKLFRVYTKKLGLNQESIKLGTKLVLHHNKLSQVAQKEDIYNPKVIANFAGLFPSEIELDMILLLTYADTNGVGNNIYNEFTARLFNRLYQNSLEYLQHNNFIDEMTKRVQRLDALKHSIMFKKLPNIIRKKILNIESNLPFIRYTTSRIIEIAKRAYEIDTFAYEITNRKFLTIEIIKKTPIDLGYLLSKLVDMNLVNMDIVKLFDDKKYFKIDFNQKTNKDAIEDIKLIIQNAFLKQKRIELPKPNIKKEDISIDCEHSIEYASIKLNTKNQKGLLAYIMNIFEKLEMDIVSSKIYTHKGIANDIFLIEKNRNFCQKLDYIIEKIAQ